MKNELTAFDRHRTGEPNSGLDIILLVFFCSSCTWLIGVPSSHLCGECYTSLGSSPKNTCRNFRPPLLIFIASIQLTFFSFFFSCTPSKGSSVLVSSSQWQSVVNLLLIHFYIWPGCPCYLDLDLETPLFNFPFTFTPPSCLSRILTTVASNLPLIYDPPFSPSPG